MSDGGFPREAFARLAAVEDGYFWFEGRNRLILWAIQRYCPDARTFLEVGCGTGFVLRAIHAALPHMTLSGIDVYEEALVWARTRVPSATLRQADARALADPGGYDAIGLFDVLEHIEEDRDVLERAFAAIRPGGGLLISVPQHSWLWSPADVSARHVRRYRAAMLTDRITQAGFEVVRATSFMTLLLPLMIADRIRDRVRRGPYDPWHQFRISRRMNTLLGRVLDVERLLIRRGAALPAGGSLLIVARRPLLAHGRTR